jgi:hypothetical protein
MPRADGEKGGTEPVEMEIAGILLLVVVGISLITKLLVS